MLNFKGVINIKKRHKETNEITFSEEYTNICTEPLLNSIFAGNVPLIRARIVASETPVVPDFRGFVQFDDNIPVILSDPAPLDDYATFITDISGRYVEIFNTFVGQSYERLFYTMALKTSSGLCAYFNLTVPCVQQPYENLDVTYRVYLPDTYPTGPWNTTFLQETVEQRNNSVSYANVNSSLQNMPAQQQLSIFNTDLSTKLMLGNTPNFTTTPISGLTSTTTVGLGSLVRSSTVVSSFNTSNIVSTLPLMRINVQDIKDNVIQSVFKKNNFSALPFNDHISKMFDNANVTISADNTYNDDNFPELYRIETVSSGPTPSYKFKKRKFLGFSGNAYIEPNHFLSISASTASRYSYLSNVNKYFRFGPTTKIFRLSDREVLLLNDTEFAVHDIITDDGFMVNNYTTNAPTFDDQGHKCTVNVVASSPYFQNTGSYTFANGDAVILRTSDSDANPLPTPFVDGTTYYVVNASGNFFNLSATLNGTAITPPPLYTNNSGDFYIKDVCKYIQATELFESSLGPKTFLLADGRRQGGLVAVEISDPSNVIFSPITSVPQLLDRPIRGVFKKGNNIWVAYNNPGVTSGGFVASQNTINNGWNPLSGSNWTVPAYHANVNAAMVSGITSWNNITSIKFSNALTHIGFSYTISTGLYFATIDLNAGTVGSMGGSQSYVLNVMSGEVNNYDITDTHMFAKSVISYPNAISAAGANPVQTLRRRNLLTGVVDGYTFSNFSNTNTLVGIPSASGAYYMLEASYVPPTPGSGRMFDGISIKYANLHAPTITFTDVVTTSYDVFESVWSASLSDYAKYNPIYMGNGILFCYHHALARFGSSFSKAACSIGILPHINRTPSHGVFEEFVWTPYEWTGSWTVGDTLAKTVHNTLEPLDNGISISFNDTLTTYDPGTAGKVYHVYACNGVLRTSDEILSIPPPPLYLTDAAIITNSSNVPSEGNVTFKKTSVGSLSTGTAIFSAGSNKNSNSRIGAFAGSVISDIPFVRHGFTCLFDDTTDTITTPVPHKFSLYDPVFFSITNSIDTTTLASFGLSAYTQYFAVPTSPTTLKLSSTADSITDVPIINTGSGGNIKLSGRYQELSFKAVSEVVSFVFTVGLYTFGVNAWVDPTTGKWVIYMKESSVASRNRTLYTDLVPSVYSPNPRPIPPIDTFTIQYDNMKNEMYFHINKEDTIPAYVTENRSQYSYSTKFIFFPTSVNSSLINAFPMWFSVTNGCGVYDQKLTLPYFPYSCVKVGNGTNTGAYHSDFRRIENVINNNVTVDGNTVSLVTAPSQPLLANKTQVYVASGSGLLVFHPDNNGEPFVSEVLCVNNT